MKRSVVVGIVGCLAVCLVIGALLAGGGYWFYVRTPTYSLRQLGRAYETHDTASFERHVDVDAVCNAAVDAFLAQAKDRPPKDKWDAAGQGLGDAVVNLLRPQIVANVRRQIRSAVLKGTTEDGRRFRVRNGDVTRDGKVATAEIFVEEEGHQPLRVDLRLRDAGGYWQVVEIANLGELMRSGRLDMLSR
jgi:hypothetical protein